MLLDLELSLKSKEFPGESIELGRQPLRLRFQVVEVPRDLCFVGTTRLFSGLLEFRHVLLQGRPNTGSSSRTKSLRPNLGELPDVLKPILGFPSRLFWVPRVAPLGWTDGDGNCDEETLFKVNRGRDLSNLPEDL